MPVHSIWSVMSLPPARGWPPGSLGRPTLEVGRAEREAETGPARQGQARGRRLRRGKSEIYPPGLAGTKVMFTGDVYLLSAPDAESIAQPIPPPRMMFPKVAPAASDLFR